MNSSPGMSFIDFIKRFSDSYRWCRHLFRNYWRRTGPLCRWWLQVLYQQTQKEITLLVWMLDMMGDYYSSPSVLDKSYICSAKALDDCNNNQYTQTINLTKLINETPHFAWDLTNHNIVRLDLHTCLVKMFLVAIKMRFHDILQYCQTN